MSNRMRCGHPDADAFLPTSHGPHLHEVKSSNKQISMKALNIAINIGFLPYLFAENF